MEQKIYYSYIPDEDDGAFKLRTRLLYGPGKNWFLTKEEAENDYELAMEIAAKRYARIRKGLENLRENIGEFSYDCYVFVHDDTGLYTKPYIEVPVNGYPFRFYQ